jgi:hypothetical protein
MEIAKPGDRVIIARARNIMEEATPRQTVVDHTKSAKKTSKP